MEFINGYAFRQAAYQFTVAVFLVGGLAVLAIGVRLIVASASTLRFITAMNHWVSTRRAFRQLDIPHDTRQVVIKYRRWLAAVVVAGAAIALYGLSTDVDNRAVSFAFGLDTLPFPITDLLVTSGRWMLIVGNLAAVAIGIMLGFFPAALVTLETRGGRWYSFRQLVKNRNAMNLPLDNWVATSPHAAGWIITVAGVVMLGDFGYMLSVIR
jgi:hypothetical protein